MAKELIIIKRTVTIVFALLLALALTAEAKCGDSYRFTNVPQYKTANRWYTSDGKKVELNTLCTDKPLTVYLSVKKRYPKGTRLIIKKKNIKITAFTKNKVLFKNDEDSGTTYAVIPVDEVLKGESIALRLEPKDEGCVCKTVRLQTANDFYFTLIYENLGNIVIMLIILFIIIACIKAKRIYNAVFFTSLMLYIFTSGELMQFAFGFAAMGVFVKVISAATCIILLINDIIIAIKKIIW